MERQSARRRGSSPLSRGIHTRVMAFLDGSGIIPALAGNTLYLVISDADKQDHPRSRGEYRHNSWEASCLLGSSPLSREYGVVAVRLDRAGGSSPLSRGIQSSMEPPRNDTRIIPALAGNTRASEGLLSYPPDHPRSRGEYHHPGSCPSCDAGSSPLSRGIRRGCDGDVISGGIIPALAGNTMSAVASLDPGADHPRSRGEYSEGSKAKRFSGGSSPLSRGILLDSRVLHCSTRIIPALAGNTR